MWTVDMVIVNHLVIVTITTIATITNSVVIVISADS